MKINSLVSLALLGLGALVSNTEAFSPARLICLVNRERVRYGLRPLVLSRDLNDIAQEHSTMQARYNSLTHDRYDHAPMNREASRRGMQYQSLGENVARGQRSEEEVMNVWMNSAVHRANILNRDYTHMGAGLDPRGNFWTQAFARVRGNIDYSRVPICP
ncbi:PR-1-like protein [Basidiobolus meristosporus CBS 931.73]|uniref:PR-1-like protein n=1 Tax=Basidiobolus meristosporus CBS 931.73 TaxID=1314790 RepID=A0A1Y1YUH3_9FUNG|nr:PR-1-like protein [Basidiobolus meristosporus CBS 931.73]|eukprot:ORY01215.1 PR-1-like protein [Basidiobolus meristosporus CBS 931.73]